MGRFTTPPDLRKCRRMRAGLRGDKAGKIIGVLDIVSSPQADDAILVA